MRLDDRVRKCVVFVGVPTDRGFEAYGTAFLTATYVEELGFQQLVTAKHVIDSFAGENVYIRVNTVGGSAEILEGKKSGWIPHPDPTVDVAVCPCSLPITKFDCLSLHLDEHALNEKRIREYGIGAGDDVYLTGVYVSRIGETRNIPVVRSGTIAAMPEEPIWPGSMKRPAYLIEVRSLAGISGSPVYVQIPVWKRSGGKVEMHSGHYEFSLGMVLGHHVRLGDVDALSTEEMAVLEEERTEFNTGLAVVVPMDQVIEAISQPELIERRKKIVADAKK
jgi:hypothetical protein